MRRLWRVAAAGVLGLSCGLAAGAEPIPLDTQAKAAKGVPGAVLAFEGEVRAITPDEKRNRWQVTLQVRGPEPAGKEKFGTAVERTKFIVQVELVSEKEEKQVVDAYREYEKALKAFRESRAKDKVEPPGPTFKFLADGKRVKESGFVGYNAKLAE